MQLHTPLGCAYPCDLIPVHLHRPLHVVPNYSMPVGAPSQISTILLVVPYHTMSLGAPSQTSTILHVVLLYHTILVGAPSQTSAIPAPYHTITLGAPSQTSTLPYHTVPYHTIPSMPYHTIYHAMECAAVDATVPSYPTAGRASMLGAARTKGQTSR